MRYHVTGASPLSGSCAVAPDKSLSHRAVILASIAEGVSTLHNVLLGEDNRATLAMMRQLGVVIHVASQTVVIEGVGLQGLSAPKAELYCGNSGTAMRLLAGLLSAQPFDSTLTGDASLSRRPMERILTPLTTLGAVIRATPEGCPPLQISASSGLCGITYRTPMVSAQVKSAILLAGLYAAGETTVIEPGISRDHTERLLQAFGVTLTQKEQCVTVASGQTLRGLTFTVPGDISSAAFLMVAASIVPGSDITLTSVGVNPTRIGVIDILRAMGADITLSNVREAAGEPVADLRVRYARLRGIMIPEALVPLAIDELPVLMVAASVAEGDTVLRGARELRVKETDRIAAMAAGLRALGIVVETVEDGMQLTGGHLDGGIVDSFGDHRIAMAFTVAGCVARAPVTVTDCGCVATSFPNFVSLAQTMGMEITLL